MTIIPVILSGGMGTRLWPLSRSCYPKQFLKLASETQTLIQQTIARVADKSRFSAPLCISNEDHRFLVAQNLQEMGINDATILLEPMGRNTAPALAIAAHYIADEYGDDAVMMVLPSDHIIKDERAFLAAADKAAMAAKAGYLTTFGITPTHAETGYGYIKTASEMVAADNAYKIAKFVEKPDAPTAQHYLESKEYVWNSGMFVFPVKALLDEIAAYRPELSAAVEKAYSTVDKGADFTRFDKDAFAAIPAESIDYAVMEHTAQSAVVPVDCGWTDAGSFHALWQVKDKDTSGNVSEGQNTLLATQNCYLNSKDGIKIAALGVQDLMIITTRDGVLVADRNNAQAVKDLVDELKKTDAKWVDEYRKMVRPWGDYDSIDNGDNHQVKRITVKPGASLSLQSHEHRSEHWVVVKGHAEVLVGEAVQDVPENGYVYIPKQSKHRLTNKGAEALQLIEVQYGGYLGEDDIVRYEDVYGRVAK